MRVRAGFGVGVRAVGLLEYFGGGEGVLGGGKGGLLTMCAIVAGGVSCSCSGGEVVTLGGMRGCDVKVVQGRAKKNK